MATLIMAYGSDVEKRADPPEEENDEEEEEEDGGDDEEDNRDLSEFAYAMDKWIVPLDNLFWNWCIWNPDHFLSNICTNLGSEKWIGST